MIWARTEKRLSKLPRPFDYCHGIFSKPNSVVFCILSSCNKRLMCFLTSLLGVRMVMGLGSEYNEFLHQDSV